MNKIPVKTLQLYKSSTIGSNDSNLKKYYILKCPSCENGIELCDNCSVVGQCSQDIRIMKNKNCSICNGSGKQICIRCIGKKFQLIETTDPDDWVKYDCYYWDELTYINQ